MPPLECTRRVLRACFVKWQLGSSKKLPQGYRSKPPNPTRQMWLTSRQSGSVCHLLPKSPERFGGYQKKREPCWREIKRKPCSVRKIANSPMQIPTNNSFNRSFISSLTELATIHSNFRAPTSPNPPPISAQSMRRAPRPAKSLASADPSAALLGETPRARRAAGGTRTAPS